MIKNICKIFIIGLSINYSGFSQFILIDRGILVENTWCFPVSTDSLKYLYLPNDIKLMLDENKNPKFSFTRYVNNIHEESSNKEESSINDVGGGGIIHFIVNYETNPEKVIAIERKLQEILMSQVVKIQGPIIFKEGKYSLVSSTILNDEKEKETKLLASGNAPVLEGSSIALSFELSKKNSKLLWESFKMPTPDLSLVFDFTFAGLTDAFDADITINWSELHKKEDMSASVKAYFVSAEIERSIEEQFKSSAISIKTSGSDTKMEALIEKVYPKLLSLLYDQFPIDQPNVEENSSDVIAKLVSNSAKSAATSISPISASVGYKLKNVQREGSSTLHFNSQAAVERHYFVSFNAGPLYKKYGKNPEIFNSISLEDSDFKKRDLGIVLDGALLPEFSKILNSVSVQLKKTHQNNEITFQEISFIKSDITDIKSKKFSYGSLSDKDKEKWMEYEYKINYSFIGGRKYETDWTTSTNALINVYIPYNRRKIQLEGDLKQLLLKDIRVILVNIEYEFLGERKKDHLTFKTTDQLDSKVFELTCGNGEISYNYQITYILKNGTEKKVSGVSNSEIFFIDNI